MVSVISNLNGFLSQWIGTLWNISWQISVLFCLVLVISFFSKKASPVFHYSIWLIIIIRAAIPFNLPVSVSKFRQTMDLIPASLPYSIPEINYAQSLPFFTAENILVSIWLLFIILIAVTILWRAVRLNHLLKKDSILVKREDITSLTNRLADNIGLKKEVPVYYINLDKEYGPAVAGILKPGIYLPKWMADEWTVRDIEPVILHELAHIKRNDLIINWIQIIVQVVYFFHPLVWAANWKIRRLREDICDDIAIECINTEKRRYGESILKVIEEMIRQPVWGMGGIGYTENKSSLARRIKRIMSSTYKINRKITIASGFVLLFVAVIGLALASENPNIKENFGSGIREKDLDANSSHNKIESVSNQQLTSPTKAKKPVLSGEKTTISNVIFEEPTPPPPPPAPPKLEKERIPPFLPVEHQPKVIGGYASIAKHLKYPEIARKAGIEGTVIVKALIGKDGVPEKIKIAKGLGNSGCNEAAVEAVKHVRFKPAMQRNRPVKFWFHMTIRFQLNEHRN